MLSPKKQRALILPRQGRTDLANYTAAGHLLWDALVNTSLTPRIDETSAGRAIAIDLPDGTTLWLTEDADVTHLPTDHEAWSALHFHDPADSGDYLQVYLGPGDLSCEADTAACVSTVAAWIASWTAAGAVARHNTYLTLNKTAAPRDTIRAAWHISWGHPGFNPTNPTSPTEQHTATVIEQSADLPGRRGACLACPWEGPLRRDHNSAVEDALDHTHPGWRSLPVVPQGTGGKNAKRIRAYLEAVYPTGWFETGGPLKVYTNVANDRHEPGKARGGGYLVKVYRSNYTPEPKHQQQSLL
ncbi:hypothetical protein GCM10009759_62410 [Kitasatospora saccharophila]|uniref:Uncharacterized protein n=1 Tax=Kitasatospora saccharophila TaxID=407973 RepID=A0ABP5JL20_9ACTN